MLNEKYSSQNRIKCLIESECGAFEQTSDEMINKFSLQQHFFISKPIQILIEIRYFVSNVIKRFSNHEIQWDIYHHIQNKHK